MDKGKAGDSISCRCCGEDFVRGEWCFDVLCDTCYDAYRAQRMKFTSPSIGEERDPRAVFTSDEWIIRVHYGLAEYKLKKKKKAEPVKTPPPIL
jgi:hypothetical protein